jgi:hypothetical protein
MDGIDDTFVDVQNGARLGFLVELKNNVVQPMAQEQRFRVMVQILGDGLILEEHLLRVVVPATRADAGVSASDASIDASSLDASL